MEDSKGGREIEIPSSLVVLSPISVNTEIGPPEDDWNFYLQSLDYGNEDSVNYTYDSQGRLTSQTYEDGDNVTYLYDNDGALAAVTDSATGITTRYYYDFTGRTMKYTESATGYSHSVEYGYDTINNLTSQKETINGTAYTTSYTYDSSNRVTSKTTNGITVEYTYDALGRISQQVTKNGSTVILTETYTYVPNSSRIASCRTVATNYDITYSYTYDDNGNILSVNDGINTTSYVYDSANQLIRENNQAGNYTRVWVYDDAGNILSNTEYAYTTGELGTPAYVAEYSYGDSDWGDLLTIYDTDPLQYDAIGNIIDDCSWQYTWEHGRELVSMTTGIKTWSFTYDANGMRTKRADGTNTYTYVYNGSQLTKMTYNSDTLYFTYDASGIPTTVSYNGTIYYYATNLQGDIVGILTADGTKVVTYTYDAWGNILTRTGTMADTLGAINPLRYQGYVYDQESTLYYITSRYYDPVIGRFINADDTAYLGVDGSLLSYNLFAYCINNPVNRFDVNGNWSLPKWAKKAVAAVAVVAVVATVAAITVATAGAGTAAAVVAVGAAKGAAIGMATGAAVGAATSAVNHRVSTGSWIGAGTAALNGMGDGALSGAVTGAITGAAGSAVKVSQAAKAWDSGTFKSGYQSMKYHYNKHVVSEGLTKGNNVLKYTQDAVRFANRNSSVLKYTYNYNYGNASWNLTYSTGQGGMFTSAGKILTFWYR